MPTAEVPRLQEMISLLLEQQLTTEEQQELIHTLESDADARATYRELLRLHVLLSAQSAPPLELDSPTPGRLVRGWEVFYDVIKQPMALGMIISGLFITTILLSLALWKVPDWRPAGPVERVPSTEFVARITDTSEATFDASSAGNLRNRDLFDDDAIILNSGLVVIEYDTGARVVLEGPATYHVQGANGGDLRLGKLAARVDRPAQGFAIATPFGTVTDLGTEFGVRVDAHETSVAVFKGSVRVDGAGPNASQTLTDGEAAVMDRTRIVRQSTESVGKFTQVITGLAQKVADEPASRQGSIPGGWITDSPGKATVETSNWPQSMRMSVPRGNDAWTGKRRAPAVYQEQTLPDDCDLVTEVVFDDPQQGAAAGPIVFDVATGTYAVQLCLAVHFPDKREVMLQSPGATHAAVPVADATRMQLKLERRGDEYRGYYRHAAGDSWRLAGAVREDQLKQGAARDPRAGVLTKSYGPLTVVVEFNSFELKTYE